jgi:hypothetical protein
VESTKALEYFDANVHMFTEETLCLWAGYVRTPTHTLVQNTHTTHTMLYARSVFLKARLHTQQGGERLWSSAAEVRNRLHTLIEYW